MSDGYTGLTLPCRRAGAILPSTDCLGDVSRRGWSPGARGKAEIEDEVCRA